MLDKIVSGGQTGADQAALDVAIKFNIPHDGWIPKGRKTESGSLPEIYQLKEMDTADYPARTKQNIMDSHGTVIISRGKLTGGSKLTLSFARVAGRPNCHIDLFSHDIFESALLLQSFILENSIRILNVAGPRASSDPNIYHDVRSIIEACLYLFFLESEIKTSFDLRYPEKNPVTHLPTTKSQALSLMIKDLDLKTRTGIARMKDRGLMDLYFSWLDDIKSRLGLDLENPDLMNDLKPGSDLYPYDKPYSPEDGVMDMIKELKGILKTKYSLRVVK